MSYINIADILWPIGSLYWTRGESPSNLFGGTWMKVSDSILYPTTEETYETNIVGSNDFTIYPRNLPDGIMWSCFKNSFNRDELKAAAYFDTHEYQNGDGSGCTLWREKPSFPDTSVPEYRQQYPITPGYEIEYIPARTLCHCYQRIA